MVKNGEIMKLKNILGVVVMSVLSVPVAIQSMGSAREFARKAWNSRLMHEVVFISACCGTGAVVDYGRYQSEKNYPPFTLLSKEEERTIRERFSKYRHCEELTIVEMSKDMSQYASAAVYSFGSKCVLHLPARFVEKSSVSKKAIIAHEATHFSKGHCDKRPVITSIILSLGCLVLSKIGYSSLPMYCKIPSLLVASGGLGLGGLYALVRRHETEAELAHKTPEELIALLAYHSRSGDYHPGCLDQSEGFKERWEELFLTHPKCGYLKSLMNQYIKQVENPGPEDIPMSVQECKEALLAHALDLDCIEWVEKYPERMEKIVDDRGPFVEKRIEFLFKRMEELNAQTLKDVGK